MRIVIDGSAGLQQLSDSFHYGQSCVRKLGPEPENREIFYRNGNNFLTIQGVKVVVSFFKFRGKYFFEYYYKSAA